MTQLRRATWWGLLIAYMFGILTLWIREAWPFAVFQALILGMASAWFVVAGWKGRSGVNPGLVLPFGVAAIAGAQMGFGWSETMWLTRAAALEWFTHGCAAVLAFQVCRDPALKRASLQVFAVGAGLLALLATLQNYSMPSRVLWLWDSGYQSLVFGPFVYHTKLAVFAELALPAALWLATTERRGRELYVVSAITLAGSVVASASRGGVAILGVELIVLTMLAGWRWCIGLAGVGALMLGIAVFGWEMAMARFQSYDPLRDLRLPLMATAWDMAGRYWAVGAGLGSWAMVYPEFARFDLHMRINQAHSDWLQWLVEGGVALVAAMLAMATMAIRTARNEWWGVGVLFVWLHGVGDYPMQQTGALTSLVLGVWGAALACQIRRPGNRNGELLVHLKT